MTFISNKLFVWSEWTVKRKLRSFVLLDLLLQKHGFFVTNQQRGKTQTSFLIVLEEALEFVDFFAWITSTKNCEEYFDYGFCKNFLELKKQVSSPTDVCFLVFFLRNSTAFFDSSTIGYPTPGVKHHHDVSIIHWSFSSTLKSTSRNFSVLFNGLVYFPKIIYWRVEGSFANFLESKASLVKLGCSLERQTRNTSALSTAWPTIDLRLSVFLEVKHNIEPNQRPCCERNATRINMCFEYRHLFSSVPVLWSG